VRLEVVFEWNTSAKENFQAGKASFCWTKPIQLSWRSTFFSQKKIICVRRRRI